MHQKYLPLTASHVRPGLLIGYYLWIDGKEVRTGGMAEKAVKTDYEEITLTVRHWKTGELYINVLHADKVVWLHKPAMAKHNPHLFGDIASRARTTMAVLKGRDHFFGAEVGTELGAF